MTKKLSPHDRVTRSLMSNPKVAEEFFQHHLPEHVKKAIDFSSLDLQKESFVGDHLKLQVVDLLYSVKFNGKPGFLYLLFEHASSSDPLLPFRMAKYMMAIMDHHLKTTKKKELPLIYPVILYTGKTPYAHSMDLFDLFPKEEKALAKEVFTSPYHLIDLTQMSDEELEPYLWFGTMARALKHIHDSNILPFLKSIVDNLKTLDKKGEEAYIYTVIAYLGGVGKISDDEDFLNTVRSLEFIDEERIMSTLVEYLKPELLKRFGDKVRAEALEEGIEKGIEKGLKKGRHERDIAIAKAMLLKGIDIDTIASVTGHSKAEIQKLLS